MRRRAEEEEAGEEEAAAARHEELARHRLGRRRTSGPRGVSLVLKVAVVAVYFLGRRDSIIEPLHRAPPRAEPIADVLDHVGEQKEEDADQREQLPHM